MRKKYLLLLLLLTSAPAGALLVGCSKEDGCQVGEAARYYNIEGLTLTASRRATGQSIAPNETVAAADLLLTVQLQTTFYGRKAVPRASWLAAAYACPPTPAPGYLGTQEALDSLTVRSLFAYDAQHPAGSSLNDLLLDVETAQPLSARGNRTFAPRLQLQQSPTVPGPQQFVLRYRLTNGELYTARTPVLTLR